MTRVPAAASRKMRAAAASGTGAAPSLHAASSTRPRSRRLVMARGNLNRRARFRATSGGGGGAGRAVRQTAPALAGAVSPCGADGRLLHRDRNVHAQGDVRHAVALVDARRGARKGYVVLLVGLREERSREVTHRIRHPLL